MQATFWPCDHSPGFTALKLQKEVVILIVKPEKKNVSVFSIAPFSDEIVSLPHIGLMCELTLMVDIHVVKLQLFEKERVTLVNSFFYLHNSCLRFE